MEMYLKVLKNWQDFSSRASRKEFWTFVGVNFAIMIALRIVGLGMFGGLYSLVMLVPNIAVSVRRFHDTDKSGWWWLLVLTGIGAIVCLIFALLPSQQYANKYGPVPDDNATDGQTFNTANAQSNAEDAKVEKVAAPENENKES
ncbi:MAG: DUF805 domain-containing protein [Candidatus Muiribacterium halophilum]|uniref:DUF805 domain-containing protein n=1 Tax=Muiribacterium halophilum TaxID=2053465 RepID=A0A2N5ZIX4_MUIH1|nr:MAG: DUF805 domain-containing protein [Candidatus Muirbacterium halophilum]